MNLLQNAPSKKVGILKRKIEAEIFVLNERRFMPRSMIENMSIPRNLVSENGYADNFYHKSWL
jgi:hypothetical protein